MGMLEIREQEIHEVSARTRADEARLSIASQLHQARQLLTPIAGDLAALEARLLAAHAWDMSPEALVRYAEDARPVVALQQLLMRRLNREPIAQILGYKDFWRDRFMVTRDVLTPRADSETLIEAVLQHFPDREAPLRILDLGTGSGCLVLSVLREYPNARGLGVDRSAAARAVALGNAMALGFSRRAAFVRGDWCAGLVGKFDVVLANPPYIPTEAIAALEADVREYEPHGALDGGADGLSDYRRILAELAPHLAADAHVFFEVGQGQAADVAGLAESQGFDCLAMVPDLAGIARVLVMARSHVM